MYSFTRPTACVKLATAYSLLRPWATPICFSPVVQYKVVAGLHALLAVGSLVKLLVCAPLGWYMHDSIVTAVAYYALVG